MAQILTLELLTKEYFWNIGSSKTLKSMIVLDSVTIGNTSNQEHYTNITNTNVRSNLFIGNLDGEVGTLSVSGNISGNVLIRGDGTDNTTMNLELELDDINSDSIGTFGSQTQIPTFNVDKYGRISQVANVTISTTLSLLDTTGDRGDVDLLNDVLRIDGTSNQIISQVSGNTFTLSLDGDMNIENLSLSGNLDVTNATSLHKTLQVAGASSLHSTLYVEGASSLHRTLYVEDETTMNSTLDVAGASSLHSTLYVEGETTINSTLDVAGASSLHRTLYVEDATTMNSTLDVAGASSLHRTLYVEDATTMNSTLDVVGASSLHSTLYVDSSVSLNSSLRVAGISTYLDNIIAQKNLTINGNIFVRGNLTQIDVKTILLSDPLIVIGNSNENTYQDLGFKFIKSATSNDYGYFGWNGSNSQFSFYETANIVDNDLQGGILGTISADQFIGNVVQANSFVGHVQGSVSNLDHYITIDFCGNVFGDILFNGSERHLTVPLELQSVFSNPKSFGNSTSVPTITVDTYGRVTHVSLNSISTTLSLMNSNGDTGIVDLLNNYLRVNGTSRKVTSDIIGNTFSLSLPNDLLVVDVSMTGELNVYGAVSLESTLNIENTVTMNSSLYVGENVNFNKDLIILGNLTVHGTETKIHTVTISIEDNKIELNTDGNIKPFGIYANIPQQGGDVSLFYETKNSRWEFNKDLYVSGNLNITNSTTIQDTLIVKKASSLESTLQVDDEVTMKSSLDVTGSTSLHNILEVAANITTPQYFIKDKISLNTIELKAPELYAGSYTLTLPENDGISNQYLQTNGSGILKWVTSSDSKTIKANVIDTVDYTTPTDNVIPLTAFTISYNTTLEKSSVLLQYKIPYESSIHANQRIKFKIRKTVGNNPTRDIGYPDILGPNNATGGTRGIYVSNIIEETNTTIGTTVTFNISAQLTSNTTAIDINGNIRKSGVRIGSEYGVGSVILTEFVN